MLLSNLFVKHKVPQPRFMPGMFLGMLALFIVLGQSKPVFALVGIGTVSILAAALVEFNRVRIWEEYRKSFRKTKGLTGLWTEPAQIYYTLNVVLLWPFILVMGTLCLWAAYLLT